jgi:hypothetical protein
MTFAPPPNFLHLPHNIFLDQVNDVGLLPAVLLLAACSLLLTALLRGFFRSSRRSSWRPGLALCWSVLSCILTQALFSPSCIPIDCSFLLRLCSRGPCWLSSALIPMIAMRP